MDSAGAGLLRSHHGHARSRLKQRVALPSLCIRPISPRQRDEKERQPVRDPVLCLQPVQCHVPKPDSVQCLQYGSPQRRAPSNRDAIARAQVVPSGRRAGADHLTTVTTGRFWDEGIGKRAPPAVRPLASSSLPRETKIYQAECKRLRADTKEFCELLDSSFVLDIDRLVF